MDLEAVEATEREFGPDRVFVGSGGDNLAASFSPELAHASVCADLSVMERDAGHLRGEW